MIDDFTRQQLAELQIATHRPLIICDVDDVVVHFLRGFDAYLAARDHMLEANSFALGGNVLHRETRVEMPSEQVSKLVDDFFIDQTEHMEAIDGAVPSLIALSDVASVVMLTNLPHSAGDDSRPQSANRPITPPGLAAAKCMRPLSGSTDVRARPMRPIAAGSPSGMALR